MRRGGGEPGTNKLHHLLDGEAVRGQHGLAASFGPAAGEKFERAAAGGRRKAASRGTGKNA
jgi:hypothetical protein